MGLRGRVGREQLKRLLEDESDDDGHVKPSKPKRLRGQVLGEKDTKTSRETVTKCALAGAREVRTEDAAGLETSRTALRDPLVRDALCERLMTRNLCTVKLEGLPKGYNYLSLLSLAPDMAACRIPHIAISHRPARTVFLEFSSHESALSNQRRLEDEYSPLEIRVSNLHKKTGKGELTRHFPNATGITMKDVNKSGRFKYEVGAAVISFGTPAEAISAFDEKHGCVVRGRRVSVMFERKKSPKFVFVLPYVFRSVQGLVVYGLKKCTKESEVRALFPQAEAIEIYPLGGFAKLRYGTVEDCKLDKKNALTAKFRGRQLKVVYLRRHGVGDEADIRPVPQGPSTCRVFVKNLGRTAKEDQVKELFKNAKLVSMPKKRHGCRGFAILDFGTTENAQKALSKRHELNSRDWHKIVPVLFPKHCLNLALSGKLQLRPDTTVMVNAEYIVNEAQVEAAAVQALANRASRKPQGKTSFSSEFLACLHPRHSINEAVTVFGVNQETKHVLFVVISMVGEEIVRLDDICQSLSAEPEEITCLSTIANRPKICAAYDVSDVELEAASSENLGMLQSILTKMSVGMLVR
nr:unnamed protein product [Spirometra erinaceieuropaei]